MGNQIISASLRNTPRQKAIKKSKSKMTHGLDGLAAQMKKKRAALSVKQRQASLAQVIFGCHSDWSVGIIASSTPTIPAMLLSTVVRTWPRIQFSFKRSLGFWQETRSWTDRLKLWTWKPKPTKFTLKSSLISILQTTCSTLFRDLSAIMGSKSDKSLECKKCTSKISATKT